MTVKPPSLDYEPLKRTSSKQSVAEDAGDSGFKRPDKPGKVTNEWKREVFSEKQAESASETTREQWVHKHGHTFSYAGIILFTAFVFFRPYEFSPSLMWLSSFAFWIALATIIIYVLTQPGLENTITARPREVNLVLLLLVTGVLSIPLALEPGRAFSTFVEFLKVILIFVVMINVVRTEKRLKMLWILVLIATCMLCINAVNDYRLGRLALQGQRIKGSIGGMFDNPNDLALHLVTIFPIALALSLSSRSAFLKILFFFSAILSVLGIVVTFSRSGFLALLAAGSMLLWKLVRSSRWLIVPSAVALLFLLVIFAPGGYKERLSTRDDESTMARFDDFKRSIFVTVRHPLVGVGMNNYILFSNSNKATHNAYTQVASEMGVAAAVIYILFIVAPFKGLRKIERESYEVRSTRRFYYAAVALQASLAGYMVASFFASVAYVWYIYYLVAYAVCLRRIYDFAVEKALAMPPNNAPLSRI